MLKATATAWMAMTLAGTAAGASVKPSPMIIPGGPLDPRFTGAEVYVGVPKRAAPGPGKACSVAEAYVNAINARRADQPAHDFELPRREGARPSQIVLGKFV